MEDQLRRPGDRSRYPTEAHRSRFAMKLYGDDTLLAALEGDGFLLKMILNESAAHIFPYTSEHSDATQPGLSYKHDSQGNALAAMLKPNLIDIRHHNAFSDDRVRNVVGLFLSALNCEDLSKFTIQYHGKLLPL